MDIIPFQNSVHPHFVQQVTLDNVILKLYFDWNTRGEFWNMRINTVADEVIISGIKLILNYELISRFSNEQLPRGYMFATDQSEVLATVGQYDLTTSPTIGRYDMDDTVLLTYLTEDEVATL